MFFPRRKVRIMLTWLLLLGFLQLLIYLVLFEDVESVPRRNKEFHALERQIEKSLERRSIISDMNLVQSLQNFRVDRVSSIQNSKRTLSSAKVIQDINNLKFDKHVIKPAIVSKTQIKKENIPKKLPVMKGKTDTLMEEKLSVKSKLNLHNPNVGARPTERLTGPSDIVLAIKTTKPYHSTRVPVLLQTWIPAIKEQVYLFTDGDDPPLNQRLDGHLINTKCEAGHQRSALCCKMQAELRYFWENTNARWFCHVDDDNYVNVPTLIKLLREFNHTHPVYLGKPSIPRKMQAWDRSNNYKTVSFWFATGGAGLCLSRSLVSIMLPYFRNNQFVQTCARVGLPDDCTLGFISENLLHVRLTKSNLFHSHLEGLSFLDEKGLKDQVTLGHGYLGKFYNRLKLTGPFNESDDPSRFKSLHCLLNPGTSWCPRQ